VALTESDRARIMETFMSDMRARSSIGPHASWLRTWVRLHERWWGQSVPPWPLSPDNIFVVAALMKDAGYRSFPNYVSAAKDTHIQMGYPWSHQLKLAVTRATASTQRGIGAAHQCQELPLTEALSVIHGPAPIVNQGPAQCGHVFIMGEFHVVRGIELISALASHLTVDEVALTETWHLPVSKTDAQAIGCSRTWGCTCGHAPACPYHTAAAHLHWLKATFGDAQGTMPPDLPLFPTITGKHTSAERLSSTVAAVADLLGKQLTDDMGRASFSEHVFRVSGSRMLARAGIPVELIKLLARWSTSIVDRYIGDAPLERLTHSLCGMPHGINFADVPLAEPAAHGPLTPSPDPAPQLQQLSTHVQLLSDELEPQFLINHRSGVYHRKGTFGHRSSPSMWRAPCGWYFGAPEAKATWLAAITEQSPDLICSTCLPQLLLSLRELHGPSAGEDV